MGYGTQRNFAQSVEHAVQRYGIPSETNAFCILQKSPCGYPRKKLLFWHSRRTSATLWAKDNSSQSWRYVHTYPLTATRGHLGPKLKEHDRQIPEGIYRLTH